MKKISILGSTGSIGRNALDVIAAQREEFQVVGLAAGKNVALLIEQVRNFRPRIVSVAEREDAELLKKEIGLYRPVEVSYGIEGAVAVACYPDTDLVLSAMAGAAGLLPTFKAVESGKTLALANKETLVMAGELIMARAHASGAEVLPVDSEHNAIHQCLRGAKTVEIKRLILTGSGGPFRLTPRQELEKVTPEEALKHPTWRMGKKITIDSATLMNKGLEIIEASWLFGLPSEAIDILIHPQSTVHSMVEMIDGSIIAQLGITDMRVAIQYALTYPRRQPTQLPPLDLIELQRLEFYQPDYERFPGPLLARRSLEAGGTMPAALNAADEVAVEAFLAGKIKFTDIPQVIESVMERYDPQPVASLETVLAADAEARRLAAEFIDD